MFQRTQKGYSVLTWFCVITKVIEGEKVAFFSKNKRPSEIIHAESAWIIKKDWRLKEDMSVAWRKQGKLHPTPRESSIPR